MAGTTAVQCGWRKFRPTTVAIDQGLVRDFDQSNFHTQGSLVYDITDLVYLEFSVWYDRVLQPRPTVDGSVPDPNDVRTVASIELYFD